MSNGIFGTEHPDMRGADIGDNGNVRFQDCSKLRNFSLPVHTKLKNAHFMFFRYGEHRERQSCFRIEVTLIFYSAVFLCKDRGKQFFRRCFTV